jgi:molybdenum cofactor guanylyltransferase
MQHREVSGVILAGGQSRRMGRDKAFIVWQGRPLIERTISVLGEVCDEVLIVADEALRFAHLNIAVQPDTLRGAGPLSGLHAGLRAMSKELGVVVAVDMPLLNADLLRALVDAAAGFDAVVPLSANVSTREALARSKNVHPLHAVYRRTCLPANEATLERGERRVSAFLAEVRVRYFSVSEMRRIDPQLRSLVNVNTPEELVRLEAGD